MADWSHHIHSTLLTSSPPLNTSFSLILSPPPHHFSFSRFSPLRRKFSLSSKISSSNNNLFIISTSEQSDGSFVYKFGDESEIREETIDVVEDSTDDAGELGDEHDSVSTGVQCSGDSVQVEDCVDKSSGIVKVGDDLDAQSGGNSVQVEDSIDNSPEIVKDSDDVDVQSGGDSVQVEDSIDNSPGIVEDSDDVDVQYSGDSVQVENSVNNLTEIVKDDDYFDVSDAQCSGVSVDNLQEIVIEHDRSTVDAQSSGESVENNVDNNGMISVAEMEDADSCDSSDIDGVVTTADHSGVNVIEEEFSDDSKVDSNESATNVKNLDSVMAADHSDVDVIEEELSDDNKVDSSESVSDVKNLDSVMTADNSDVDVIKEELSDDSKVDSSESISDVKDLDTVMPVDHSGVDVIEKLSDESKVDISESVSDVKDLNTVTAVDHSGVDVIEEESSDVIKVGSSENVLNLEDLDTVVASEEEKKVKDAVSEDDVVEKMVELVVSEADEKVKVVEGEGDVVEEMVELVELPVLLQAEPILDEEVISDFVDDVVSLNPDLASKEVESIATPSILQFEDDPHNSDVSEIGSRGPQSSVVACSETSPDSIKMSTLTLPAPCAGTSSLHSLEVNDAVVATLVQSDDDLSSEISIVADLDSGTSEISTETSLNRLDEMEDSEPLLFLESATASLANLTEVLAGGEDAYFLCDNWFGVADGVGQWSFAGTDKGLYAREFMLNCEKLVQKSQNTGLPNVKALLQQSAAMTESTGSARVLVAHFIDQALHVANVGDSGFVIIRNGVVFKKSSPLVHEFNFPYAIGSSDKAVEAVQGYHVELEDGDIVVTATDGLFDNLYEQEIASIIYKAVEGGKSLKDIAELLATKAQEVGTSAHARTPFADAAQAAGHAGIHGGKFDHVTVIVSAVQRR